MSGFVVTLLAGSTSAACVGRTGSVPGMRRGRRPVGDVARTVAMSRLRVGDVADGWHGVPGYPQAAANVVSCDVVRHQSEERRQRARAAAGTGARQLRDGLDLAAQAAAGDGPVWSGLSHGDGRSRRNLRRWPGRGQAWSGRRSQDHCRRGRRKARSGHRPDPPSAHQGCVGG